MVDVTVKLYASLASYLPRDAARNVAKVGCRPGATVQDLLTDLSLPQKSCHLVLVNGLYVAPDDRSGTKLKDGDAVAVWPPIAGG